MCKAGLTSTSLIPIYAGPAAASSPTQPRPPPQPLPPPPPAQPPPLFQVHWGVFSPLVGLQVAQWAPEQGAPPPPVLAQLFLMLGLLLLSLLLTL